jgi:hypothetical protein
LGWPARKLPGAATHDELDQRRRVEDEQERWRRLGDEQDRRRRVEVEVEVELD